MSFLELLQKSREQAKADLKKRKVDLDGDGESHPAQYFEGLDEETKRKREKEIERRKKIYEETGKPVYGPLPGDEDIDKAKQNKGTKSKKADEVREEIKKPGKAEFIRACSKVSGVSKKIIETVYDKGLAAYATSGHRPGQTPQSWSRARVYAFLFDSKSGARKADKDLWDKHLENKRNKSVNKSEETNSNIPKDKEILTENNTDTLKKTITLGDLIIAESTAAIKSSKALKNVNAAKRLANKLSKGHITHSELQKCFKMQDRFSHNKNINYKLVGGEPMAHLKQLLNKGIDLNVALNTQYTENKDE